MLYLSKGMVLKESSKQNLCVTIYGTDHILTGIGAELWLAGRLHVNAASGEREERHLQKLQSLGLLEIAYDDGADAHYSLLTRCIICPAQEKTLRRKLSRIEKQVYQWISSAGLRLTIGELVKLFDSSITLMPELLGAENAQTLTLAIYSSDLCFDTVPDIQMSQSPYRDQVVNAVLGLLRKKRILLT